MHGPDSILHPKALPHVAFSSAIETGSTFSPPGCCGWIMSRHAIPACQTVLLLFPPIRRGRKAHEKKKGKVFIGVKKRSSRFSTFHRGPKKAGRCRVCALKRRTARCCTAFARVTLAACQNTGRLGAGTLCIMLFLATPCEETSIPKVRPANQKYNTPARR